MQTQKLMLTKNKLELLKSCLCNKKDLRDALMNLNIRADGSLESTNGKMLVRVSNDPTIPAGVYKILAVEKIFYACREITLELQDCQYPATDQVIPKETNETLSLFIQAGATHCVNVVKLFQFTQNVYSEKYLDNLGLMETNWTFHKAQPDNGILATTTDGIKAVIMPLQLESN